MSKVSKENLSAMEIREARLKTLYKILPFVSVLLLILLWLLAATSRLPPPCGIVPCSYLSTLSRTGT